MIVFARRVKISLTDQTDQTDQNVYQLAGTNQPVDQQVHTIFTVRLEVGILISRHERVGIIPLLPIASVQHVRTSGGATHQTWQSCTDRIGPTDDFGQPTLYESKMMHAYDALSMQIIGTSDERLDWGCPGAVWTSDIRFNGVCKSQAFVYFLLLWSRPPARIKLANSYLAGVTWPNHFWIAYSLLPCSCAESKYFLSGENHTPRSNNRSRIDQKQLQNRNKVLNRSRYLCRPAPR